jgi:predicted nucleic acid-binding protein
MNVFMDTAAFLALLNANDQFHLPAKKSWDQLLFSDSAFFSSNYIVLETTTLLQHRFGTDAVRLFVSDVLPVIKIIWIDEEIHMQGMSALLTANRRKLSLVDCTSFEIVRRSGLDAVFTFDPHFQEQGFDTIPENG